MGFKILNKPNKKNAFLLQRRGTCCEVFGAPRSLQSVEKHGRGSVSGQALQGFNHAGRRERQVSQGGCGRIRRGTCVCARCFLSLLKRARPCGLARRWNLHCLSPANPFALRCLHSAHRGVVWWPSSIFRTGQTPLHMHPSRLICRWHSSAAQHKAEFQAMLDAAKAGPKCKQLSLSELPKYVSHYPELAGNASCSLYLLPQARRDTDKLYCQSPRPTSGHTHVLVHG